MRKLITTLAMAAAVIGLSAGPSAAVTDLPTTNNKAKQAGIVYDTTNRPKQGPAGSTVAPFYRCGDGMGVLCGSAYNGGASRVSIDVAARGYYPEKWANLPPETSSRYAGIADVAIVSIGPGECGRKRIKDANGNWGSWGGWIHGPAHVGQGRADTYWNATRC